MKLDGATVLLQWAAGGLLFGWVTVRRREVGLGYGWLLRITYGLMALAAALLFLLTGEPSGARTAAGVLAAANAAAAAAALGASVAQRRAGVAGPAALRERRRARVAAMLGDGAPATAGGADAGGTAGGREFSPAWDLPAPAAGCAALLAAAAVAGGPVPLAAVRLLVGAAFLGVVTDAMLLGHWYLVQPGLPRDPLRELVRWCAALWPFEVAAFLWPTGVGQVFTGAVDDGYQGLLAWVWAVCAVSTIGLVGATWLALRERAYAAVMAATGLLYLAILTAFGTDLVPRAVLTP